MEETTIQTTESGVNNVPAAEVQANEPKLDQASEPQTETGVETKPAAEVEDGTEKAFAARLAKERQKIEQQHSESLAKAQSTLQKAAKIHGFTDVDSYLAAVDQAEKDSEEEEQARLYQENPAEALDKLVEKKLAEREMHQQAQQQQRSELEKKPYYSDLKAEIDQLCNELAKNGQPLDLGTVYNFVLGQRAPELIEKAAKATAQSTIADLHDRARRGVLSNDGSAGDDVDTSVVDVRMANAFGNDPKEIAKYVHQQTKRS